ncbi:autotransporter outer membrane beta-barrel domain-containing protein [Comamonas koreensis]|uniref:Autotransporter outer membrane beta-barrel domain-containing protein n=1 Tax=Comamonas koreensis TaxID=160825 RepID=A0AAW4XSD8_9BURK|nr:autotransporter outer membrane beta-barrel domain-containing protein [Comamonas koreensis]MCD2164116.1 autotransporter outer membrane beta-barrel domain-containing protein [Comamonas koreensis]
MKTQYLPHRKNALFAACLLACATGMVQAQNITFSGDSTPVGSMGPNYNTTDITIGNSGAGALAVDGFTQFGNTGVTIVGANAGSTGTVTMTNSSNWETRDITVGQFGTGIVNLNNSTIASSVAIIGQNPGGTATVTVDGGSWNIPPLYQNDMTIGSNGGSGTLRVLNGGGVATSASFNLAATTGSAATVLVDGPKSNMLAVYNCSFGVKDVASVQITNGGQVECYQSSYLGFGTVSLNGADSMWILGDSLDVGNNEAASNAVLTIGEGSAVSVATNLRLPNASSASANSTGTINIEGSSIPGVLTAGTFEFGVNGQGVVNFNHTDASGDYQFGIPLSGSGTVNSSNSGTTLLTGANSYAGNTNVNAGILRAGAATALSPASDFVVAGGGTLDINTYSPTVKTLANAGTVTMLSGGTTSVLTVAGNYSGNGGSIALNTILGDSSSATEKLVVNGATSGNTILNISNLGGTGAPTTGEGILVVQVDGASNGTFSLPAPGYLEAGTFRYDLVKTGNNWYLVSESRAEASGPGVTVVCSPAELSDAVAETATCKVSLSAASTTDLSINLNVPGANPRYTTTCTSPLLIPANATEASCTITSVANNTPGDGDVTALLAVLPPTVADAYTVAGPAAQVVIKDKDQTDNGGGENPENPGGENPGGENPGENGGGTAPHKVPTMGAVSLAMMASIMGWLGLRRTRQSRSSAKTA